jgi:di/tricarboxylate transporter
MWISNTATTAMMIPIVDAISQVAAVDDDPSLPDEDQDDKALDHEDAPLASPDLSNHDTEPMVVLKVIEKGSKQAPDLAEIGRQSSKYFESETQKKAKIARHRNLLLMAVAYSANIGGTGVITGSPPNLVVPQVMENR